MSTTRKEFRQRQYFLNLFDKPSAEPSLLGLCRGEKSGAKANLFDKPSAEPSLLGLCRGEKSGAKANEYKERRRRDRMFAAEQARRHRELLARLEAELDLQFHIPERIRRMSKENQ